MKKRVQAFLKVVTQWAETKPEILGMVLVGSYARGQASVDSDVDLVLLALSPEEFIRKPEWIKNFGMVKTLATEDWGLVTSLRVFYNDGLEVEYGVTSLKWVSKPIDEGTCQVMHDGMQVLVDKTGVLRRALREAEIQGKLQK